MSMCAWCESYACSAGQDDDRNLPVQCPIRSGQWLPLALTQYEAETNRHIARSAADVETSGYCKWTRLEEVMEFAKRMEYRRIGLAFCSGLKHEARIVANLFDARGFETVTATCSCGGVHKGDIGIPPESRFRTEGFEAMCNPIGQAMLMNEKSTDFNVVLGLCVGHDSLFFRYAEAPATVLAAKDRVLAHNPLAAVYLKNSYYRRIYG